VRRGTESEWASSGRILEVGEPGYATDTGKFAIGDGVSAWDVLPDLSDTGSGSGSGVVAAPATPSSPCTTGQRAWASPYLYTCVASDAWVRNVPERTW
jgi:hypothetical protein